MATPTSLAYFLAAVLFYVVAPLLARVLATRVFHYRAFGVGPRCSWCRPSRCYLGGRLGVLRCYCGRG